MSNMPTRKVSTMTLAGAVAAITAWASFEFFGVDLPPGIEAAAATVFAFIFGYLIKESEVHNV